MDEGEHMESLQKINDSIAFIENNLASHLSIEEAAKIACMSRFHFQRMSQILTGFTVAEYIRKRRLTLAAQELIHSNVRVLDIALKYGYESPESFSKAFRKAHGISPIEVRHSGKTVKAFPKLSFQIQLKGEEEMNYKIIQKEAFQVVGKGIRVSMENNNEKIPLFWKESNENGFTEKLAQQAGEMGILGVCAEGNQQKNEFTYYIAVEKTTDKISPDLEVKEIPASTWAVFESVGPMPHAIQHVWKRIFSEWFPATGYEHAPAPEIEVYPEGDAYSEDYRAEIWIPVIKK